MTDLPEYKHTPDMGEISGFGGGYEEACQTMLDAGVKWSLAHKGEPLTIRSPAGVYGLVDYVNDAAQDLEKALLATNVDPTGAMMHTVTERVFVIHDIGWDEYCKQLREHEANEQANKGKMQFVDLVDKPGAEDFDPTELVEQLKQVFGADRVILLETPEDFDRLGFNLNPPEPKQ